MGYYTTHTFEELGVPVLETTTFKDLFKHITDYDFDTADGGESIKWYDCESHMCELSKLFPSTVFIVYGDGEEEDDHWKAAFCNGDMKRVNATFVYPDIDIAILGSFGTRHPELLI